LAGSPSGASNGSERYEPLRDALFVGYERVRPLPLGASRYLDTFQAVRALGIVAWAITSARDNPSFVPYAQRAVKFLQWRFG